SSSAAAYRSPLRAACWAAASTARPGSALGALERGRGRGYLEVLEDPGAGVGNLLDCLRRDTRWDWEIDDRAAYHAQLMREAGVPIDPLLELLNGPDVYDCDRAGEVLTEHALLGSAPAREALRDYLRHGQWWQQVLWNPAHRWPEPWWDDLAPGLVRRLAGERPMFPSFESWLVRRGLIPAEEGPAGPHRSPETDLGADRLLAVAADSALPYAERSAALRELGRRPEVPVEILPLVAELWATADDGSTEKGLMGLRPVLEKLGPLALEPAREWAATDRRWLRWQGLQILAEHGGIGDVPTVVAYLERQWDENVWCGPMVLVGHLARFGPRLAETAPLLRAFWRHTPHSCERPSYLRALHAIVPEKTAPLLHESLWDCEPDARLYAVRHAPDSPELALRLAELRDSPVEEDELREAAARRLG
ncbi:hypothetical protein, partial [Kitasatospora sp. NPDC057198]|uniref:hypothetical protein n=1 Tax=Kitasatospora sp. NPDC057198 TaxID=3346046 RepID=UPI00362FF403